MNLNKALLLGNLTRDPELRYTPNGTAVADLGLAVNRNYTTNGEKREETLFIGVVVWGKQAEACGDWLHKGSQVLVEGRITSRNWETKDGQKRTTIEVVADRVEFGAQPKGQQDQQERPERQERPAATGRADAPKTPGKPQRSAPAQPSPSMADEDEVPF